MLKLTDYRKNKNSSAWVTMLYDNLKLWIEPCFNPLEQNFNYPTISSIESSCNNFYQHLLSTDQRHFSSTPKIRRSQDDQHLSLYDSHNNLIFIITETPEQEQSSPKIYGYARVSTPKQNLNLQIEALEKLNCDEIVQEKISAFSEERALFNNLLNKLNKGDTLAVWKLNRLGRSTLELYKIMAYLTSKEVNFVSITENIDTKTPTGKIMFGLLSVLAEYEADQIKERAEAGRIAKKKIGNPAGRPKEASKRTKTISKEVVRMYQSVKDGKYEYSTKKIAKILKISEKTIYKCLEIEAIPRRSNFIKNFV